LADYGCLDRRRVIADGGATVNVKEYEYRGVKIFRVKRMDGYVYRVLYGGEFTTFAAMRLAKKHIDGLLEVQP
jgi:hypothetical protein